MKKFYSFYLIFILTTSQTIAQVGIGTTNPNSNTMLDIKSDETKNGGMALYIDINGSTTSSIAKHGIFTDFSNITGDYVAYGLYQDINTNEDITVYGTYNLFSGLASSSKIGLKNVFLSTTRGYQTGLSNSFDSNQSENDTGLFNRFQGNISGDKYGTRNIFSGDAGDQYALYNTYGGSASVTHGVYNSFTNGSSDFTYGLRNIFNGQTIDNTAYGLYNTFSGDGTNINGELYGVYNSFSGVISNADDKYGFYNVMSSGMGGTHYGIYSDVKKTGSYSAYFLGNVAIGTQTSNTYVFPSSMGTSNQIMQTDGSGNLTWQDPSNVFLDADEQSIDLFGLNGTVLYLSIENDATAFETVDLAALQDGTGTDNQDISGSGLLGTNLTIGIENGNSQVINLSSLQDGTGTDNQDISGSGLSGTNLTIGIEDGNSQVVNLASLQDGTGTDDQSIDAFTLSGTTLNLSLENDGVPAQTVNLSSIGGDITGVIAGAGLTGGGTTGNVTVTAAADNGLYVNAGLDRIKLGGALNENTTITQGASNMTFNLNSSGDFIVQDNGTTHFQVDSGGITLFGDDSFWRDASTTGTNLVAITDDVNDGRLRIYENGITAVDLDANTGFTFNEQGLNRDFRIEGDGNENVLFVDANLDRIGIKSNTPSFDLHLKQANTTEGGSGGIALESSSSSNNWKIYHSGSHFSFAENGTRRAYVQAATGNYVITSDKKLKKNISRIDDVLSRISKLNIYRYHYLDQSNNDQKVIGVMAQELQPLFPSLVNKNEDGNLGVNYSGLSVIAIKAIKEQNEKIILLEKKIDRQEKEIKEIKNLLLKMKQ